MRPQKSVADLRAEQEAFRQEREAFRVETQREQDQFRRRLTALETAAYRVKAARRTTRLH